MNTVVMNSTTLPVRVMAFRIRGEKGGDDHIVILLTLSTTKPPRTPLMDVTLRKDVHPKALVPGAHEGMRVTVDNRAHVDAAWVKSKKGDRILLIKSVLN